MCLGTVGRARGAARQNAGRLVRALSEKKSSSRCSEARPTGKGAAALARGAGAPASWAASWAALPVVGSTASGQRPAAAPS